MQTYFKYLVLAVILWVVGVLAQSYAPQWSIIPIVVFYFLSPLIFLAGIVSFLSLFSWRTHLFVALGAIGLAVTMWRAASLLQEARRLGIAAPSNSGDIVGPGFQPLFVALGHIPYFLVFGALLVYGLVQLTRRGTNKNLK